MEIGKILTDISDHFPISKALEECLQKKRKVNILLLFFHENKLSSFLISDSSNNHKRSEIIKGTLMQI